MEFPQLKEFQKIIINRNSKNKNSNHNSIVMKYNNKNNPLLTRLRKNTKVPFPILNQKITNRNKIYKMIPSLEIVDQMQKNGQEIDTSDYGNESSSFDEEEDDYDEEESDESDGKDGDSKESMDDYNEENEDDEGGKKKRKNK